MHVLEKKLKKEGITVDSQILTGHRDRNSSGWVILWESIVRKLVIRGFGSFDFSGVWAFYSHGQVLPTTPMFDIYEERQEILNKRTIWAFGIQ